MTVHRAVQGAAHDRPADDRVESEVSTRAVRDAVVGALAGRRVVLAVSGGLDSSVLLDAAARWTPAAIAAVATFDHGTGRAATDAAQLVIERCGALGLPVVHERAGVAARDEAAWRRQRWAFLRRVAGDRGALVATAHTEDDQLETVVMRILRGAGARGLAGLYAASPVLRPLLGLRRSTLERHAASHHLRWVDDPSNASRAHLRNRVRLDLLPALTAARPGLGGELLALARRAATWRAEVDALARSVAEPDDESGELRVSAARLADLSVDGLAVLWPAIAALRGVALDRRGTRRLAEFTMSGRRGGAIQLSGSLEVVRRHGEFVLRPLREHTSASAPGVAVEEWPLDGSERRVGRWRLVPLAGRAEVDDDLWQARLPAGGQPVTVREWQAGDRVRGDDGVAARRVKRFFKDSGIAGVDRSGWPVVLLGGDVVWIPGIRRTAAATVPSGRPGVSYACLRACDRDHD